MDPPAADCLKNRLARFERSIDDVAAHFSELESFGRYCASAPFREMYAIRSLLDLADRTGCGDDQLVQEYSRISAKLASFRSAKDREYRDLLLRDLVNYTHVYHAAVCHANSGQAGPDILEALARRDLIRELCRELGESCDLSGIAALLSTLDSNLLPEPFPSHVPTGNAGQQIHPAERPAAPEECPSLQHDCCASRAGCRESRSSALLRKPGSG